MSDVAIRVEGLGKRFRLRHQSGAPRYRTLREDLLTAPRELWARLRRRRAEQEEFWALKDVSFEVKRGEVLGIIGRNGAGKSTLLKILSRIMDPTTGEATVYGRIGSLLEVGTGFHPELTGRENIYLSGALLGMKRAEVRRRFDEIVEFAGVEKFLDTPCKHYSSGMYTRLGFAVAAHLDTEILLVDEVLAVGDAEFQRKCLGKMSEVAQGGRTILLVSHNMNAIRALSAVSIWLSSGRVLRSGPTVECLGGYLEFMHKGCLAIFENDLVRVPAHGDGRARIRGLRVLCNKGSVRGDYAMGEEFIIESTIEVIEALRSFIIGFHVTSSDGLVVFCSNSHDSLSIELLSPGGHCFTCRVPGVTLAPGRYSVTFAITSTIGGACHDYLADAVSFSVEPVIFELSTKNEHFLDGRPGILRVALEWSHRAKEARDD